MSGFPSTKKLASASKVLHKHAATNVKTKPAMGKCTSLWPSTRFRPLYAPNAGQQHLIVPQLSLFTHYAPGNAPRRVHSTSTFAIYPLQSGVG